MPKSKYKLPSTSVSDTWDQPLSEQEHSRAKRLLQLVNKEIEAGEGKVTGLCRLCHWEFDMTIQYALPTLYKKFMHMSLSDLHYGVFFFQDNQQRAKGLIEAYNL